MSSLGKATPGEGTRGERPGAEISLVLEENANPIGKGWQEQGLERQKETKPCKTLKPTVMQILWKVKEDFKQQGHHVCVYF